MLSCYCRVNRIELTTTLDAIVQNYLHAILGIATKLKPWAGAGKLPYFLQDAFELRELKLQDRQILLAIDRQASKPALANVRSQLDKLSVLTAHTIVYVTSALASYERKRLIEQKVPFIVPGNQLYLPDLGIDLREYFRQRPKAADTALSPATQAMLIAVLLRHPWQPDWEPGKVVIKLGYTPMTLSRAVRELTASGIATVIKEGRVRWLRIDRSPAEVWKHVKPLLRSPVKRSVWVLPGRKFKLRHGRLASLSAMAHFTTLAEPQWPIYAVSPAQWKEATLAGLDTLPDRLPGACEWQLWHYNPALVPNSATVDPLSLTLSLQDDADERVQLALEELQKHFPASMTAITPAA